jgi:hypothetical protein
LQSPPQGVLREPLAQIRFHLFAKQREGPVGGKELEILRGFFQQGL